MLWVKKGDCNSKFFHRVANGRHNKKCIKALENEKVAILDNIDNISAKILNFFGKLYASPPGES